MTPSNYDIESIELGDQQLVNNKLKDKEKNVNHTWVKWQILKETFVEFSHRTDINAYGKIFEYENSFVKLLWSFILLGSLSLTAWVLSNNVLAYLQYGVVSQIGVVYETPTEFPAVTFCDNNPFTTGNYPDVGNLYANAVDDYGQFGYIYLFQMAASNPSYGDVNRKLLGLNNDNIENIFGRPLQPITCRYNNTDCSNELHWYWHYDYGNCFQFNVGLNATNSSIDFKKSNREGADNGLQITVVPLTNTNPLTQVNPSGKTN